MTDIAREITKKSQSSFYYAFKLLPTIKRDAMNTVYAFCRQTDDIIDEGNLPEDIKYERLRKWRIEFEKALKGKSEFSLLNKVAAIIKQFNIPIEPFFELIKGVEMDLQRKRYLSFEDLIQYCYMVASTVGLMCIEIFGYKNKSTRDYAINLGLAMQMTNIIRDVKRDADNGRIYLPQEDFKQFEYSEVELLRNVYNPHFVAMMNFEADRADMLFKKADRSLDFDDKSSMIAARAMQHIYCKLLRKLRSKDFNIFREDISISNFEKTTIAVGVWAKYSLVY